MGHDANERDIRQSVLQTAQKLLEERIDRGERLVSELVLAEFPELSQHAEMALELIYLEYVLVREQGESISADDIMSRFPQFRDELAKILEVDSAMSDWDKLSPPSTHGGHAIETWSSDGGSAPDRTGRIGDYELLEVLGHGGMGVVYKARQLRLNRLVALKTMDVHVGRGAALTRFKNEAELAASLQHPNIVQLYEVGMENGVPFFSMELIEGGTLAGLIREHPLPADLAASLLEVVARGVGFAHSKGVIHRDLKPANVLLQASDRIEAIQLPADVPLPTTQFPVRPNRVDLKIADFGLAKQIASELDLTVTGMHIGTPGYMAPEQFDGKGRVIGPSSDVYALGAMLYTLLVGRPPFLAATPMETLHQALHADTLPPRKLQPKVPKDLETICMRCLEKEPTRRYVNAIDLAEDLRRYQLNQPIRARPVGTLEQTWKWSRRHPSLAALVVAVILASTTILWLYLRAETSRRAEQITRTNAERLLYASDLALANLEYRNDNVHRSRELLDKCDSRFRHWEWSYLNRLSRDTFWESPPTGSPIIAVAMSPDGRFAASGHGEWGVDQKDVIRVWDVETGKLHAELDRHPSKVFDLNFSPDGKYLASVGSVSNSQQPLGGFVVWDVASGEVRVDQPNLNATVVRYSSDGKSIFVGHWGGTISQHDAIDGRRVATYSTPISIVLDFAFSPDGSRLAACTRDGTLSLFSVATIDGNQRRIIRPVSLMRGLGDIRRLAWCGNGRQLYVASFDGQLRTFRYVDDEIELVDSQYFNALPYLALSPDGQTLAISSLGNGTTLRDSDNGKVIRVVRGHNGHLRDFCFDARGMRLCTGGADGTLIVTNLTKGASDVVGTYTGARVAAMASHPTDPFVAVAYSLEVKKGRRASGEPRVEIRKANTLSMVRTLKGGDSWYTSVAYHSDGSRVVAGSEQGGVYIWNAHDASLASSHHLHQSSILHVGCWPSSDRVVSLDHSGRLLVWDTLGKELVAEWQLSGESVIGATQHPDYPWIAVGVGEQEIMVWDCSAGREKYRFKVDAKIATLGYSPDGGLLAVALQSGATCIFEGNKEQTLGNAQPLRVLRGHTQAVTDISFSSDGTRLVTTSLDESTKLFDVQSGVELLTFQDARGVANHVLFHRGGKEVLRSEGDRLYCWSSDFQQAHAGNTREKITSDSQVRWHLSEAARAERRRSWSALAFHHSQLMQLEPEKLDHYQRASEAYCFGDETQRAEECLLRAIELAPRDVALRTALARLYLRVGRMTEYQQRCQEIWERVAFINGPTLASEVVWVCGLSEQSGIDPVALGKLLDGQLEFVKVRASAVKLQRKIPLVNKLKVIPAPAAGLTVENFAHVIALNRYRQGDYEAAKTLVRSGMVKSKSRGRTDAGIRAICLAKQGETEEAVRVLKMAERQMVDYHEWSTDVDNCDLDEVRAIYFDLPILVQEARAVIEAAGASIATD